MTRPNTVEYNSSTKEYIEREMNDAEFECYQKSVEEAQVKVEKEAARAELLKKLGINEDEAQLLLG